LYNLLSGYKYTTIVQFGIDLDIKQQVIIEAMTQLYTRTGDDGYTGLLGEGRVPKHDNRLEAVGALDEATAALGVARAACQVKLTGELLLAVQRDLYHLMAEIAATPEHAGRFSHIDAGRITWLEEQVDALGALIEIPKDFIVPGDAPAGAALALARTIVRRAERRVAALFHSGEIANISLLSYLNRLSSLCFGLELLETQATGKTLPTLAKE
jgi:cob(I)alamin adenosyltransferase